LEDAVRYLVVKALTGRKRDVEALYEYLVLGARPSEISRSLGLTRNQVRSYARTFSMKFGNTCVAGAILSYVYPYIAGIEPVMRPDGDSYTSVCTLCGRKVPNVFADSHVLHAHRDLVEEHVSNALEELMKRFKPRA